ncbi:MAG: endolytic transglycosylase MltG, partial [Saprospiraceae bacterium]|nr:endolytic transglycosylase MltG [Saprospiraceae bacterium]
MTTTRNALRNRTAKSSCLRTAIIILLLFLCLGLSGLFAMLDLLPKTAAKEFGPAAPSLDPFSQAFYSARLLLQQDDLQIPVDLNGTSRTFKIQNGDTVNIIALHLEDAGLIRDAGAFRLYLIYSGADTSLQAGDFPLSSGQSTIQIAKALQDANAREITFRILAGWRIEEVAAGLAVSGLMVKPDDFIQEARLPTAGTIPPSLSKFTILEGFLFPSSYKFKRTATITE